LCSNACVRGAHVAFCRPMTPRPFEPDYSRSISTERALLHGVVGDMVKSPIWRRNLHLIDSGIVARPAIPLPCRQAVRCARKVSFEELCGYGIP